MGGLLSSLTGCPEPTDEDRLMAGVVVPVAFEKNFALDNGSTEGGGSIADALKFDRESVPNLYTISGNELKLAFQEHGVAYNETAATDLLIEAAVGIQTDGEGPGFTLTTDWTPVRKWGINFAGRVLVKHEGSEGERVIYLPGTRTYDPAGLTGDPHASERIGPSCSRTQLAISLVELVAVLRGAQQDQVNAVQEKLRYMVNRYHGREVLFDWMKLQIEEAVFKKTDVTPYPEYIKALIRNDKLELNETRQHTKAYLESYNRGLAHPPLQYYQKVNKKDKVEELLSGEDLSAFKKIIGA